MFKKMLSAKIQNLKVTGKNLDYIGSITLPRSLIEKAGIHPFEAVLVINLNNGNRFETYVMPGEENKVELNGGAARLGETGDRLIVFAFNYISYDELSSYKPKIIIVNDNNEIVKML